MRSGRFERIVIRFLLTGLALYSGYLQTGQASLEGGEVARDTDTVALLKVTHALELRIQALEIGAGMEPSSTIASPPPVASGDDGVATMDDVESIIKRVRAKVTPHDIDTYQRAR